MSIRERNGRLEVIVYFGRDPHTGRHVRRSRTVHGTGRDARRAAKQLEADLLAERDTWRDRPAEPEEETLFSPPTVGDLLDRWLAAARHEESTRQRTDSALDRHVRPALGAIRVDELTVADLNDFYQHLEQKGLAPATVVRTHGMIRAALEHAVREEILERNPAARVALPKVPTPDPRPPDAELVVKILKATVADTPELARFIRVAAATGLRRGAVCAFRHSDLDLDRLVVRTTHAIGEGKNGLYEKTTKSGARHAISIDQGTAAVIAEQIRAVTERAQGLDEELVADPYLFTWKPNASKAWSPNSVTKTFARIRKTIPGAGAVQLKHLRHFVATILLAEGIDVGTVAHRLSHARTSTTTDIYAAFMPASDRAAADVMGRILDA